jgi:hypothetical protein
VVFCQAYIPAESTVITPEKIKPMTDTTIENIM